MVFLGEPHHPASPHLLLAEFKTALRVCVDKVPNEMEFFRRTILEVGEAVEWLMEGKINFKTGMLSILLQFTKPINLTTSLQRSNTSQLTRIVAPYRTNLSV